MKKYYEAYDERYKDVHELGLLWMSRDVTPELLEWINFNNISLGEEICEIGCGEGRDAISLAKLGYKVTGIDISKEAIKTCCEIASNNNLEIDFICIDATNIDNLNKKFKYIYSIATLHMLVLDEDRRQFLKTLNNLLEDNGKCLLVNLGDGKKNHNTDINDAFLKQKRTHQQTKKEVIITSTSFRCVDFETHKNELKEAGFEIIKKQITSNHEYNTCMTMYLIKK